MSGRTPVGARGIVRRTLERCGLRALADALLHPEPLALPADDPLLADAARQARRTLGELRRLRLGGAGPAAVRFALETDGGATEHVWGEVLALHAEDVIVRVASRPVTQRGRLPARLRLPLAAVEDWQVVVPGGAVRGGFSALAMIAACRRDGRPIPRALRKVRFLDAAPQDVPASRGAAF